MQHRRSFSALIALATVALAASCYEPSGVEQEPFLRLTPRAAVLQVGEALDFTLTPAAASFTGRLEARDSSVVHITAATRVVGASAGGTYVLLRSAGRLDSAAVAVTDGTACPPILTLFPTAARLEVGDVIDFRVFGCGVQHADFQFTSDSPAVSVTAAGTVTAVSRGSAVISARLDGVVVTAVVEVE
jgi:hypothetical protein